MMLLSRLLVLLSPLLDQWKCHRRSQVEQLIRAENDVWNYNSYSIFTSLFDTIHNQIKERKIHFNRQYKLMLELTRILKVERGSSWIRFVLMNGADEDIIHINDSHWFLPNESPTNITVLFLIFCRNFTPLNLLSKH